MSGRKECVMKQWFALSAIGRDRPGIVAELAELIYDCDCNLEDSSMAILGSEFAVLLLLTGTDPDIGGRLSAACKRIEWERRLTVFFRPLEGEPTPYGTEGGMRPFELQTTGVDKAGIVARVCRCLADHGINITHLGTQTRPEPETGTPVFTMRLRMDVPQALNVEALRRHLAEIADALCIEVTLGEASPSPQPWLGMAD